MIVNCKFTGSVINPDFPEKTWLAYMPTKGIIRIDIPSLFGIAFNVDNQIVKYLETNGVYNAKYYLEKV
jgi:hypothetical protein